MVSKVVLEIIPPFTLVSLRLLLGILTLAIVLVILWALGFLAFNVTSGLIHILLVIAAIIIVARIVTGRRPVV